MAESRPRTLLNDLRLPFHFSSRFDREVDGIRNYRAISHTNGVFVIHRDRAAIQRTAQTLCRSAELRSYYSRSLFRLLNHHVYSRRKQNKQVPLVLPFSFYCGSNEILSKTSLCLVGLSGLFFFFYLVNSFSKCYFPFRE